MPFHTEQLNRIRQDIQRAVPPNEARALTAFLDIADQDLTSLEVSARKCDLRNSLSEMLSAFQAIDLVEDAGRQLKFAAADDSAAQAVFERSGQLREETVEFFTRIIEERCFRS